MKEAPRVLCAVDFSRANGAAFRNALAIAKRRSAKLDVVLAVPLSTRFNEGGRDRMALMTDLHRAAAADGVDVTVAVQQGDPAGLILLHANSSNSRVPDLIVLGAPVRKGTERLRFGSVAERVLRVAPCPTLVVRASDLDVDGPAGPFERILCPVDFSPASVTSLGRAVEMLREGGRVLRLLHVLNGPSPLSVPRLARTSANDNATTELRQAAWRRLQELAPVSSELRGKVYLEVTVGPVGDQIARAAIKMDADVVVVGVSSRGMVGRLFGSTTARVLRTVGCSVLAVPGIVGSSRREDQRPETRRAAA
ncbi:MAG: universal stress protein [Acidobacteriota bacterium]